LENVNILDARLGSWNDPVYFVLFAILLLTKVKEGLLAPNRGNAQHKSAQSSGKQLKALVTQ